MRRFICSIALLVGLSIGLGATVIADEAPTAVDAARARVANGDTMGAIGDLAPYVQTHPADVPAGRLLGDLYFRVPDYRRAEATWKALVARDPGDRETHNRLGGLYAVQDRVPEAIGEFEKSLPLRDSFAQLVELHRRTGDLGAFLAAASTAVQAQPSNLPALVNYSSILRALHRDNEALPVLRRIVGLKPDDCAPLIDLATNLLDLDRVDEAMAQLNTCLKLDPHSYWALVNLGEAYIQKHDIPTAKKYIDAALVERPNGASALVDRGYIADVQGRSAEAIRSYQLAIASEPLEIGAYINLGYDYNDSHLYPLAEATFLKGLSVAPTEGRLHYLLAVTYTIQGKIALARSQFDLAIKSGEELVIRLSTEELSHLPPQAART